MRSFEIPTHITYPEVNEIYNFAMIDRHVSASKEVLGMYISIISTLP
jgi:hypothetical protein